MGKTDITWYGETMYGYNHSKIVATFTEDEGWPVYRVVRLSHETDVDAAAIEMRRYNDPEHWDLYKFYDLDSLPWEAEDVLIHALCSGTLTLWAVKSIVRGRQTSHG